MDVVALHGKLRDSKILPDPSGFGERFANRGEHDLTAQGLEFTAQYDVHRVKRRVRFARSVKNRAPASAWLSTRAGPQTPAPRRLRRAHTRKLELNWAS
jgi:hypothetical protein